VGHLLLPPGGPRDSVVGGLSLALMAAGLVSPRAGRPSMPLGAVRGLSRISKGTVPLALFGPGRYAVLMGRLALPGLLARRCAFVRGRPYRGVRPTRPRPLLVDFTRRAQVCCPGRMAKQCRFTFDSRLRSRSHLRYDVFAQSRSGRRPRRNPRLGTRSVALRSPRARGLSLRPFAWYGR